MRDRRPGPLAFGFGAAFGCVAAVVVLVVGGMVLLCGGCVALSSSR